MSQSGQYGGGFLSLDFLVEDPVLDGGQSWAGSGLSDGVTVYLPGIDVVADFLVLEGVDFATGFLDFLDVHGAEQSAHDGELGKCIFLWNFTWVFEFTTNLLSEFLYGFDDVQFAGSLDGLAHVADEVWEQWGFWSGGHGWLVLLPVLVLFLAGGGVRAGAGARAAGSTLLFVVIEGATFASVVDVGAFGVSLSVFLAGAAAAGAAAAASFEGAVMFFAVSRSLTGFVGGGEWAVVSVDEVAKLVGLRQLLGLTVGGLDFDEGDVQLADDESLVAAAWSWFQDDLVGGDRRLDGVALEVSGQDDAADGGFQEEVSHLSGSWLHTLHVMKTVVVFDALITVAVVSGLDNFDDLSVSLQVWERDEFGLAGDDVLWELVDVVEGFAFAGDGVFHGLVHTVIGVVLGVTVESALDGVFSLDIDLDLGDHALEHIGFPVGGSLLDDELFDGSVAQSHLELVLGEMHVLEVQFAPLDLGIPSVRELGVHLSVLGPGDLADEDALGAALEGEGGLHEHSGILVSYFVQTGQGAALHFVVVLGVAFPSCNSHNS